MRPLLGETHHNADLLPLVVFSKSYCPYCNATKKTLDGLQADYIIVELDKEGIFVPSQPTLTARE